MSANHPEREEGVLLHDIKEIIAEAEARRTPWPELPEPRFSIDKEPSSRAEVVLWTMAGILGALTIYAIATGDREVLLAILGVATGAFLRRDYLKARPEPPPEVRNESSSKSNWRSRQSRQGSNDCRSHTRISGPPRKS